jgi:hypothetical protein
VCHLSLKISNYHKVKGRSASLEKFNPEIQHRFFIALLLNFIPDIAVQSIQKPVLPVKGKISIIHPVDVNCMVG